MKKLLLLFAILILGCSGDDSSSNNNSDNNNPGDGPLVLSIISTDSEISNYVYTDTYTYEENKLESVTKSNSQGSTIYTDYFVYTNDKVVRIDRYVSYDSEDPTKTEEINYSYDSQGRLSSTEVTGSWGTDLGTLNYNSNGSVNYIMTYTENNSPTVEESNLNLQFDNNDNLINASDSEVSVVIEYDNFNSPFKNIVGLNFHVILFHELTYANFFSFNNNCTSYVVSDLQGDNYTYNYDYDYNQDGYPRQIIAKDSDGFESTIAIQYSN